MEFTSILNRFSGLRMLVIGDIMLDHYIWGDVTRISPEAPVPIVNVLRDTYSAGGAANVAFNLANLGVETSLLGYYADDEAGKRVEAILKTNGVKVYSQKHAGKNPTIIKTRVVVKSQQLCRIDRESSHHEYAIENSDKFFIYLHELLAGKDAVIISDYAKGVVTQSLVNHIIDYSRDHPELLVAIDPKPSRKLKYQNPAILTPNRTEALQLAGYSGTSADDPRSLEDICQKIHQLYSPILLVITLGSDGMAICEKGEIIKILPTVAREVFDVSGAGDTVIATITAALSAGANSIDAAKLANFAAGTVVAHMGTVPVDIDELKLSLK
ncbi:MAG: PfkB family carbohydrate kinase [Bacteroidota bacterium]